METSSRPLEEPIWLFKEKIDEHPAAEAPLMKRDFTRVNFGWWGFWAPTDKIRGKSTIGVQPDMWEYGTSKAAAWDSPISIQMRLDSLDAHPRSSDIMEVMRRWEDVRKRGLLTPEQKEQLKDLEVEHTLLLVGRSAAKTAETAEAAAEIKAETSPEDVPEEVVDIHSAKVETAGAASHLVCGKTELVVLGALVRVTEHGIGLGRLLEVLFGGLFLRVRAVYPAVRVPFEGQFPVRRLDFIGRCLLVHPQDLIVVSLCHNLCAYNHFSIADNLSAQGISGLHHVYHLSLHVLRGGREGGYGLVLFRIEIFPLGIYTLQALPLEESIEFAENHFRAGLGRLAVRALLQSGKGNLAVVQDGEKALDYIGRCRTHQGQLFLCRTAAERVKFCHEAQVVGLCIRLFLLNLFQLLVQALYPGFQSGQFLIIGHFRFIVFLLFCHNPIELPAAFLQNACQPACTDRMAVQQS